MITGPLHPPHAVRVQVGTKDNPRPPRMITQRTSTRRYYSRRDVPPYLIWTVGPQDHLIAVACSFGMVVVGSRQTRAEAETARTEYLRLRQIATDMGCRQ
jgi:hypothetical protein